MFMENLWEAWSQKSWAAKDPWWETAGKPTEFIPELSLENPTLRRFLEGQGISPQLESPTYESKWEQWLVEDLHRLVRPWMAIAVFVVVLLFGLDLYLF